MPITGFTRTRRSGSVGSRRRRPGVTDHLTELAAHLEDTNATVRRNLTLVFAEVGAVDPHQVKPHVGALEPLLQDSNDRICQATEEALVAVASTIQTGTDVYHPETRVRDTERE